MFEFRLLWYLTTRLFDSMNWLLLLFVVTQEVVGKQIVSFGGRLIRHIVDLRLGLTRRWIHLCCFKFLYHSFKLTCTFVWIYYFGFMSSNVCAFFHFYNKYIWALDKCLKCTKDVNLIQTSCVLFNVLMVLIFKKHKILICVTILKWHKFWDQSRFVIFFSKLCKQV